MKYKKIWISDTHLGSYGCNAEALLNFIIENDADEWDLVGDFIDFWALKRRIYWPKTCNTIIQKLLKKSRKGAKIRWIRGNHDDISQFVGMVFADIEIVDQYIYTTILGKKLLVLHGDQFDIITLSNRWIAVIGDVLYTALLKMNKVIFYVQKLFHLPRWSLSKWIKHKVKDAVKFISSFEKTVIRYAEDNDVDGVVCGHIHVPKIEKIGGYLYCNTGDWVENCSAIVEHTNGKIELIHF